MDSRLKEAEEYILQEIFVEKSDSILMVSIMEAKLH